MSNQRYTVVTPSGRKFDLLYDEHTDRADVVKRII